MTTVTVLTPAGTGAIATVAVHGSQAWPLAQAFFRTARNHALPEHPPRHRFWFGRLAEGDEVVLAVKETLPDVGIEIHCHGGRRVVQWVVDQFVNAGCVRKNDSRSAIEDRLAHATTFRSAAILLDQFHGAFEHEQRLIEASEPAVAITRLRRLRELVPLGRHLVTPWRVVLAGPPNAGKSSLLNALAGFQRSVVSTIAGTTRDVVTVPAAFEGWPIELADTAGLRRAADALESEGIERAREFLTHADLVVWLLDAGEADPPIPDTKIPTGSRRLVILHKCDLREDTPELAELRVSSKTGEGVADLAAMIAKRVVPSPPEAGAAVPWCEEQVEWIATMLDSLEKRHQNDPE